MNATRKYRRSALLAAAAIVTGSAGIGTVATASAVTARHGGWHFSKAYSIPHLPESLNGLSCPTEKECVATASNKILWTGDAAGGKGHWKGYVLESHSQPGVIGDVILGEVSCASAHLCVAIDNAGQGFVTSNPTGGKKAWHPVYISGISIESVGCSSAGTCAAVDYNGAVFSTKNPSGAWTAGDVTVGTGAAERAGVSCAGSGLCAIVSGTSRIATTTSPGGTHWHSTKVKGGSWNDVSCPSTNRCVAVAGTFSNGRVAVSGGASGWKSGKLGKDAAAKIDCPSSSSCFVLSDYYSSHPAARKGAWTKVKVKIDGVQSSVSCPTPKRCYVGTSIGKFTVGHR
jgi:hypothetical protein